MFFPKFIVEQEIKLKSSKGEWAHFPSNYTNFQGGDAFIFEAIFLRFCMKIRLVSNSRNALQNVKNKRYNNIVLA